MRQKENMSKVMVGRVPSLIPTIRAPAARGGVTGGGRGELKVGKTGPERSHDACRRVHSAQPSVRLPNCASVRKFLPLVVASGLTRMGSKTMTQTQLQVQG